MRLYLLAALLTLALAPAPLPRKPEVGAARVVRALESYRTVMPPAQGLGEQNGLSIKELEPYIMSHLAGVAQRMGVKTQAECRALLPYIRDRDFPIRFIAIQAINGATGAYPHGMSVEWLFTTSDGHVKMARRFEELIARMEP